MTTGATPAAYAGTATGLWTLLPRAPRVNLPRTNAGLVPFHEQLYSSGGRAVAADQASEQILGFDDDPERFRQLSAGPRGGQI